MFEVKYAEKGSYDFLRTFDDYDGAQDFCSFVRHIMGGTIIDEVSCLVNPIIVEIDYKDKETIELEQGQFEKFIDYVVIREYDIINNKGQKVHIKYCKSTKFPYLIKVLKDYSKPL